MQETYFHCQSAALRGSGSHCWACLSQTGSGAAVNQTAAAAVVAAVAAAHFSPVQASVWLLFWPAAYFSAAFAVLKL